MNKIACVNGQFMPESSASISIFDRGFLFGDGVYEAVSVVDGKLLDMAPHLDRLDRSLAAISMRPPYSHAEIIGLLRELIDQNSFVEGLLYFQVTRGVAPRTFNFPPDAVKSSFIAFTMPMALLDRKEVHEGIKLITIPEQRWKRRDIKSIGMLPQCLGKQAAVEQGCYEALMIEDGMVTEGTSSSAYIIKDNTLITRPLSPSILPGVTRRAVLALAEQDNIKLEERTFSLEELYQADECCITAASNFIMPAVEVDKRKIGSGKPGPITLRLRTLYIEEMLKNAI
jgi:D-alanine transaminase